MARLAKQAKVVAALRAEGFAGARYERLTLRLTTDAAAALERWCRSGEIFRRAAKCGRPVTRTPEIPLHDHDCATLAVDAVLAGQKVFHRTGMVEGQRRPDGGADLQTYFRNACVLAFPNVYRAWERKARRRLVMEGTPLPDDWSYLAADPVVVGQRVPDPAGGVVVADEVRRVLQGVSDPLTLRGLALRAIGFTQRQAADEVGLTEKALESRIARVRRQVARELDQESGGTGSEGGKR